MAQGSEVPSATTWDPRGERAGPNSLYARLAALQGRLESRKQKQQKLGLGKLSES